MSALTFGVLVREPVPTRVMLTVVGLVHPEATVALPLSPGARPTIVTAGVLPVPWYAIVIVKCVLSVMENPVAETFATVLAALRVSMEPPSLNQPVGPDPRSPDHWLFNDVVCCDGVFEANALLRPYPTAPAPSPTRSTTRSTVLVEIALRKVG